MKPRYLFEFCDQNWVPASARECLFEIMEACNSGFRSFNELVANKVLELAREEDFNRIVELGAGHAPITTQLATKEVGSELQLVPCDITPNEAVFRNLADRYPDLVLPVYESVDITLPQEELFRDSVLVLGGMMHHVPFDLRPVVLQSLSRSHSRIAIFEPLKRTLLSMLLATLSFFPAILLPMTFFRRPGKLRRMLWCWLIPIVPGMFVWDGIVSCLRQWTEKEWREEFAKLADSAHDLQIHTGFNSLLIVWSGREVPEASFIST